MDRKEILECINANPMAVMCTVEGDKPRGRGMETFRADENGLIFYTGKYKDVYKQLESNPEVELCYMGGGMQVRVRGRMELLDDPEIKKEVVEQRPMMKGFVEQMGYEHLAIIRLKGGQATTWTASNRAALKFFVDL